MNLRFYLACAAAAILACLQATVAQVACPARCRSCDNNVAECSRRSLNAPPTNYPAGTRTINLEGNHIRVIAERTFGNSNSVEVLKISRNKIVALRNDGFSPFPNLVSLDLVDNRISRVSRRAFKDLSQLRTLSLNRNKLESLEGILQHLPNLYQLNLANNRITSLGQNDLSAISGVHFLDLRDNLVAHIHSQAFKNLTSLRNLLLNNNPLTSTPPFEFGSSILQLVDFSNCFLQRAPGPLPSSVSDLRLGHNRIMRVNDTDLINITDLQLLALNDNDLHFLADGALSHLSQLREVWLRHNSLVYIPRGIPNSVRKVYMDSNNIQQVEAGLFNNMSQLDYLTVESNQINRILPNTFAGLRFLTTLNFQGNRIQNLEPGAFVDLGSLSTLLLSNNPMVRIEADAFRNLGNLSHLFLSYIVEENFQLVGNFFPQMLRLQSLHLVNSPGLVNDIMNMINDPEVFAVPLDFMLQLDLSYNTLEWVSPRIREVFPNLQSLFLDGNPLRCSQRLKWLKDWMVSSQVSFHQYQDLMCENPPRLRGRVIRGIQDSEWASEDEDIGTGSEEQSVSDQGVSDQSSETGGGLVADPGFQSTPTRGDGQGTGKRSRTQEKGDSKGKRKGKGKGKGKGASTGKAKSQSTDTIMETGQNTGTGMETDQITGTGKDMDQNTSTDKEMGQSTSASKEAGQNVSAGKGKGKNRNKGKKATKDGRSNKKEKNTVKNAKKKDKAKSDKKKMEKM